MTRGAKNQHQTPAYSVAGRPVAAWATRAEDSAGRLHPEPPCPMRTAFQRDRDRIVHATSFRRLTYKTQVFVFHEGDHYRTRLTHSLEVAQIARAIARLLWLDEDLAEALALAHDLGHPPFGHAGEEALAQCMLEHGGFEHNRHGLRIVDQLEYRYADFPGLNLSWEVLEAQAMHSKLRDAPEVQAFLGPGQPLLEAQVVDAADSLAYDTHDIDDALGAGLISFEDLEAVPFWRRAAERIKQHYPGILPEQFQAAVVRELIDWQVRDLLEQTETQLREQVVPR
jgi:dGTPase